MADAMRCYMAINEEGTHSDTGLHAKLAVLSARRHTSLALRMLYLGERNDFTRWLERRDVEVVDVALPFAALIDGLSAAGRYDRAMRGHWLRTGLCLVETADTHALYTDVDVVFRRDPDPAALAPAIIAAAPEFERDGWNYFNSGVMAMNVVALRDDHAAFERYIRHNIAARACDFHDQLAYNEFYRGRWERLAARLNWKPYWGVDPDAEIVHFHGPKVGAIEAILRHEWDWSSGHGAQIGSLFAGFLDFYRHHLRMLLEHADGLSPDEADRLHKVVRDADAFTPDPRHPIDLSFMGFRMFPDNAVVTADQAPPQAAVGAGKGRQGRFRLPPFVFPPGVVPPGPP